MKEACSGYHGSQKPCGLTANHEVPPDRSAVETPAEPRPTCLHDFGHPSNTLIIESHWAAGTRIRCTACGGCAEVTKKGKVKPETCECHAPASPEKTSSPQCDTKCFDWPRCECGRGTP